MLVRNNYFLSFSWLGHRESKRMSNLEIVTQLVTKQTLIWALGLQTQYSQPLSYLASINSNILTYGAFQQQMKKQTNK